MTDPSGSERSRERHTECAGLAIRPAVPHDVEELARLFRRYRDDVRHFTGERAAPSFEACWQQMAAAVRRPGGAVLVADDGHQIVGFCVLRIVVRRSGSPLGRAARLTELVRRLAPGWLCAAPEERIAFMDDLYVAPEARRRGVALPLMRAAFAWGRAQGVAVMEGATWPDNQAMLRLARHFDIEVVRVLLRKRL